jgi:hypothetical protein
VSRSFAGDGRGRSSPVAMTRSVSDPDRLQASRRPSCERLATSGSGDGGSAVRRRSTSWRGAWWRRGGQPRTTASADADRRRAAAAAASLERAPAIREKTKAAPVKSGSVRWSLARALGARPARHGDSRTATGRIGARSRRQRGRGSRRGAHMPGDARALIADAPGTGVGSTRNCRRTMPAAVRGLALLPIAAASGPGPRGRGSAASWRRRRADLGDAALLGTRISSGQSESFRCTRCTDWCTDP